MKVKNSKDAQRQPAVSIIVPVYNAEKYLNRCIDSALQQEWADFELILADDGSTDRSSIICDEYASQDTRVRVLHKSNSGVSDTRNQAISLAKGRYLQFLDSDDWLTPDATRLMMEAAQQHHPDLVIANFYRVAGNRIAEKGAIEEEGLLSKEEFAENMMENPADFYYGVLWNKLYRRSIVEEHKLCMNVELDWCEDFLFNLEYCCYADTYFVLQSPVYYYVKRRGSLVSQGMSMSKVLRMKTDAFDYYSQFYRNVWDEEAYEKKRRALYRFFIDSAGDGFVPPLLLSNAQKLGSERFGVHRQTAVEEGIISDLYCTRKLLERETASVAQQYNLAVQDALLLLYLNQARRVQNRKELADILGMPKAVLSRSIQTLQSLNMIQVKKQKDPDTGFHELEFAPLPKAAPILAGLEQIYKSCDDIRLGGLSGQERELYLKLAARVKENVREALK